MTGILNITNGDSAVGIMKKGGVLGDILPWQDVLHDGPVPDSLSLTALSAVRAEFIAGQGWGELEQVKADFIDRDNTLQQWQNYSQVILWFEHDLYDQLQILQILDWFSMQAISPSQLTIICTENYLGMQKPEQICSLFQFEQKISAQHMVVAKTAWKAFRSDTPQSWVSLLHQDTSVFPFLADAIVRLMEEYPNPANGLSRIQQQVLQILQTGGINAGQLFVLYQQTEQKVFLGDLSFWVFIKQMIHSDPPLISISKGDDLILPLDSEQVLTITPTADDILKGKGHWLDYHRLDRWLGGVHLTDENIWFWDREESLLSRVGKD